MPQQTPLCVHPKSNLNFSRQNRFKRLLLIATALGVGWFASGSHALAQVPQGVFSLSSSGKTVNQTVLDNPNVMGVSIRYGWSDLEPTEGNFNWSFLDSEVARIGAAGKKALLRIATQNGKPAWVTQAVRKKKGKFFTFDDDGVATTIPVFWDPTYLEKKKNMIVALGAHFTNNPTVAVVTASFANASSEDWNVPHTQEDITNWFKVGYTTDKLLDAGKQIIDATMAAFPHQYVALAIGGNGHTGSTGNLDPTADYVAENAILNADLNWPGRLIPQINSLSTFNPPAPADDGTVWNLLWVNQPDTGTQMVYWCFDEDTYRVNGGVPGDPATVLTKCVDAAVAYKVKYIEIYQKDVINLPSVITYAKRKLTGKRR